MKGFPSEGNGRPEPKIRRKNRKHHPTNRKKRNGKPSVGNGRRVTRLLKRAPGPESSRDLYNSGRNGKGFGERPQMGGKGPEYKHPTKISGCGLRKNSRNSRLNVLEEVKRADGYVRRGAGFLPKGRAE